MDKQASASAHGKGTSAEQHGHHRGDQKLSDCACSDNIHGHKLIAAVTVSKSVVQVNESVFVQVKLRRPSDVSEVTINGVQASSQFLQFSSNPGVQKILVNVVGKHQRCAESRTLSITVMEPDSCVIFPLIQVARGPLGEGESTVELTVPNYKKLWKGEYDGGLQFLWTLGAAGNRASEEPNGRVVQSFEDSLAKDDPQTAFHIEVTIRTPPGRTISAMKTISVWNLYAVNKQRGRVMPKATYDFRALKDSQGALVAKSTMKNVEKEPILLQRRLIEYLVDDPDAVRQFGTPTNMDQIIPPLSSQEVDCSTPYSLLPKQAYGYAVHFRGQLGSSRTPVHVSCYFEHREPSLAHIIKDPIVNRLLHDMRNDPLNASRTIFTHKHITDHLEKLKAKPYSNLSRLLFDRPGLNPAMKPFTAPQPNFPGISSLVPDDPREGYGPLEGNKCLPDEEPSDEDLACQLTPDHEMVYVPARIINACKGDSILSPGGMGPIGIMLRALNPSQMYAHCGIMSKNYYEITNSTADEDWLMAHLAGSVLGIKGTEGTEGIDPKSLKYLWPGVVSQSIGAAFEGVTKIEDPEKVLREVKPFDYRGTPGQNDAIAEALVVKPEPMLEAQQPTLRPLLHKVAAAAAAMKGHYRFFCFTESSISSGRTIYNAPDEGPSWWASTSIPACCSSLIWAAMKSVKNPTIQLEGPGQYTSTADLEPKDKDPTVAARVDRWTRDGLYRYEEDNRARAANVLYENVAQTVENKLREQLGGSAIGWLGNLLTDAKDDGASQVCNAFAFDWSGENNMGELAKDSHDWKEPGIGHAVSPDNILLWDAPTPIGQGGDVQQGVYGYAERLIYRPAYVEMRPVSRWVRTKLKGTINGTVYFQGAPVPFATANAGGVAVVCNDQGQFTAELLAGPYQVTAGKLWTDGLYYQGSVDATVEGNTAIPVAVILAPPSDAFREIIIKGTVRILDSDTWSDNPSPPYTWAASGLYFGEYYQQGMHREQDFHQGWADEVRIELHMAMDLQAAGTIRVTWTAKLFEGDSADTDDLEQTKTDFFDIPRNEWRDLVVHLDNPGLGGGDTGDIALRVWNNTKP